MNDDNIVGSTDGLCADSFEISRFRDGELVLSCGKDGMETDLVFASGAIVEDDPTFEKQRKILDFILRAVHNAKLTGPPSGTSG